MATAQLYVGRVGAMAMRPMDCACSILNAREEKLMDDDGRVQVRLICNRCSSVLDSEIVGLPAQRRPFAKSRAEAEAAEGS